MCFVEFSIFFFLLFGKLAIDIMTSFVIFIVFDLSVSHITDVYFYMRRSLIIYSAILSAFKPCVSHSEPDRDDLDNDSCKHIY